MADKSRIPAGTTFIGYLIANKYQICTPLHRELTSMLAHDTDPICCMAYVKAEIKYAYEQGKDTLQHFGNQLFAYLKDGFL